MMLLTGKITSGLCLCLCLDLRYIRFSTPDCPTEVKAQAEANLYGRSIQFKQGGGLFDKLLSFHVFH
jgi:hypothetical protein